MIWTSRKEDGIPWTEVGRDFEVPFQGGNDFVGGPAGPVEVGLGDLEPVERRGVDTVTTG